jgi:hypothetical protein
VAERDLDTARVLSWGPGFVALLDNPAVSPMLGAVLGAEYRLDHVYSTLLRPAKVRELIFSRLYMRMVDWWLHGGAKHWPAPYTARRRATATRRCAGPRAGTPVRVFAY